MRRLSRAFNYLTSKPRGLNSLLLNSAKHKLRRSNNLSFPSHVTIEPTTRCNLRCPICETGNGSLDRSLSFLDFDKYTNLVDECFHNDVNTILLYFMGESFLHPRIYDMIAYASRLGIFVDICTNGDIVKPSNVLASGVGQLSVQIGGMCQETHSIYRKKSQLDRVLKNVFELNKLQSTLMSDSILELGFIVMKHNEHEVPQFIDLVNSLENFKGNIIDPCVRNLEEADVFLPENKKYWFYDIEAYSSGILRPAVRKTNNSCSWIWNSAVVMVDGSVVPCCRDPRGTYIFGNAFESSLASVWNGSKAVEFREMILSNQSSVSLCELCAGYGYPQLLHENGSGVVHDKVS